MSKFISNTLFSGFCIMFVVAGVAFAFYCTQMDSPTEYRVVTDGHGRWGVQRRNHVDIWRNDLGAGDLFPSFSAAQEACASRRRLALDEYAKKQAKWIPIQEDAK